MSTKWTRAWGKGNPCRDGQVGGPREKKGRLELDPVLVLGRLGKNWLWACAGSTWHGPRKLAEVGPFWSILGLNK